MQAHYSGPGGSFARIQGDCARTRTRKPPLVCFRVVGYVEPTPEQRQSIEAVATVDIELGQVAAWHTRVEDRRAIFEFIKAWYNRRRRHSSMGHLTPAAIDERLWQASHATLPRSSLIPTNPVSAARGQVHPSSATLTLSGSALAHSRSRRFPLATESFSTVSVACHCLSRPRRRPRNVNRCGAITYQ